MSEIAGHNCPNCGREYDGHEWAHKPLEARVGELEATIDLVLLDPDLRQVTREILEHSAARLPAAEEPPVT